MKTSQQETLLGLLTICKADSFLLRLKGLLFTKPLAKTHCLLIEPCNAIHTFGMGYCIHVLCLSADNKILAIKNNIQPNRMYVGPAKTKKIVELSGELEHLPEHILNKKFVEGAL